MRRGAVGHRRRGTGTVVERVTQARRGYHVAAYACEARIGSGVFTAFYKVCDGAPDDYWQAHCLIKGATQRTYASPTAALVAADALAQQAIGNLPVLDHLRALTPECMFRFIGLAQWPRPLAA
ncbi:MAG: hypothetical protein EOO24_13975 [Comamonadaceae bacterium]|nr:MAG: hypothetical protein EOO24_13975 [Comamonadaceae bacterium]